MRLLSDWLVHMVHFWPADASVKFYKQTNLNLHKAIMVWGNRFSHSTSSSFTSFTSFLCFLCFPLFVVLPNFSSSLPMFVLFSLLLCHLTPFSHLSFFLLSLFFFLSLHLSSPSLSLSLSLSLSSPPQSPVAGCEFAGVSCPNAGCHEMVLAIQLQSHLAQCLYRLVTCSHCQEKLVAKDLEVQGVKEEWMKCQV